MIYASGTSEQWGLQASWARLTGRVIAGHLALHLSGGAAVDYAVEAEGRLIGRYTAPAGWRV